MKKPAANIGICKSRADGSRVSTFVFQFGFISGRTLIIWLCTNLQLLFINLASGSRADEYLFPSLRKYLLVRRKAGFIALVGWTFRHWICKSLLSIFAVWHLKAVNILASSSTAGQLNNFYSFLIRKR